MIPRRAWLAALPACAAGCALPFRNGREARLGSTRIPLLPPSAFGPPTALVQRVAGEHRGKAFAFTLASEIRPTRCDLVGLTDTAFRLFVLQWDGRSVDFDRRFGFRLPIPPRTLLAAWQLAYWPLPPADPAPREWRRDGLVVASATHSAPTPWDGPVLFTCPDERLRIEFRTFQRDPLET